MAEDKTRISPLKADQAVIAHDTPVTAGQHAMFNKTFAPKTAPVIPPGTDPAVAALLRQFPNSGFTVQSLKPAEPSRYPEGTTPKRAEKLLPSIYGKADATRAEAERLVDAESPAYASFTKWADANGLSERQRLEILKIRASEEGDEP